MGCLMRVPRRWPDLVFLMFSFSLFLVLTGMVLDLFGVWNMERTLYRVWPWPRPVYPVSTLTPPLARPASPVFDSAVLPSASKASVAWTPRTPSLEWKRTRQAVAGLRFHESDCRYWRDQRGEADPDVIAANLERLRCYPE